MNREHKLRWISGLIGLFVLVGIYYAFGHYGVVFLTVFIAAASYYEFLTFTGATRTAKWISAAAGIVLCTWLCLDLPGSLLAVYLAALAILLRGLWRVHSSPPEALVPEFQFTQGRVFGLLYMIVFPSFVARVHALAHGPALLLFLIGIIWLGDIGAYYGGKLLGKHKLSPQISPGKTWEGAVSGLLVCAIWAVAYGSAFLAFIPGWKWVLIAILSSIVAQAGDLMESLMKRAYSVKDSGGWIPGHGGFFDRFDSLILAVPFFYFLLQNLA